MRENFEEGVDPLRFELLRVESLGLGRNGVELERYTTVGRPHVDGNVIVEMMILEGKGGGKGKKKRFFDVLIFFFFFFF